MSTVYVTIFKMLYKALRTTEEQKAVKLALSKSVAWALEVLMQKIEFYIEDLVIVARTMLKIERKLLLGVSKPDDFAATVPIDNFLRIFGRFFSKVADQKATIPRPLLAKFWGEVSVFLFEFSQILIGKSRSPTILESNWFFLSSLYRVIKVLSKRLPESYFWVYFDFTLLKVIEAVAQDWPKRALKETWFATIEGIAISIFENDELKNDMVLVSDLVGSNQGYFESFINSIFLLLENSAAAAEKNLAIRAAHQRLFSYVVKEVVLSKTGPLTKLSMGSHSLEETPFLEKANLPAFDGSQSHSEKTKIEDIFAFNQQIKTCLQSFKRFSALLETFFPSEFAHFKHQSHKDHPDASATNFPQAQDLQRDMAAPASRSSDIEIAVAVEKSEIFPHVVRNSLSILSQEHLTNPFYFFAGPQQPEQGNLAPIIGSHEALANPYLKSYLKIFDFSKCDVLEALNRLFLMFNMRAETQAVERILTEFAQEFADSQPQSGLTADNVFFLCFAIMMLNTDLHTKYLVEKMEVDKFIKNVRYGIPDTTLPDADLEKFYARVAQREIQTFEFLRFQRNPFSFQFEDWKYANEFLASVRQKCELILVQKFIQPAAHPTIDTSSPCGSNYVGNVPTISSSLHSLARLYRSKMVTVQSNKYVQVILRFDEKRFRTHEYIIFCAYSANTDAELTELNRKMDFLPELSEMKGSLKAIGVLELQFALAWNLIERQKAFARQFVRFFFNYFVILRFYCRDSLIQGLMVRVGGLKDEPIIGQKEVVKKSGFGALFGDLLGGEEEIEIDSREEIEAEHAATFLRTHKIAAVNESLFRSLVDSKRVQPEQLTSLLELLEGIVRENKLTHFTNTLSFLVLLHALVENAIKFRDRFSLNYLRGACERFSDGWKALNRSSKDCFSKNLAFLRLKLAIYDILDAEYELFAAVPAAEEGAPTPSKDNERSLVHNLFASSSLRVQELILRDFVEVAPAALLLQLRPADLKWLLELAVKETICKNARLVSVNKDSERLVTNVVLKLASALLTVDFSESIFLLFQSVGDIEESGLPVDIFQFLALILAKVVQKEGEAVSPSAPTPPEKTGLYLIVLHHLKLADRLKIAHHSKEILMGILEKLTVSFPFGASGEDQVTAVLDNLIIFADFLASQNNELVLRAISVCFEAFGRLPAATLASQTVFKRYQTFVRILVAHCQKSKTQMVDNEPLVGHIQTFLSRLDDLKTAPASEKPETAASYFEATRTEMREKIPLMWIKIIEASK